MKARIAFLSALSFVVIGIDAATIPVTFVPLTGTTGGSPAQTAVYRANLSGIALTSLLSIAIQDNSFGLGGAPGQFSGFDLDAIKLSTTPCSDAACAASASGMPVFNFTPVGTIFVPGTQRIPADPKLFGTDASGTHVDNTVATLNLFDGNSTTAIPGAFGFVSMGDGGTLSFNLTSAVSPTGLYLYIGEVGDNGEVAAGHITVSDLPVDNTPEPGSSLLIGTGLLGMGVLIRTRRLKTARAAKDAHNVKQLSVYGAEEFNAENSLSDSAGRDGHAVARSEVRGALSPVLRS